MLTSSTLQSFTNRRSENLGLQVAVAAFLFFTTGKIFFLVTN